MTDDDPQYGPQALASRAQITDLLYLYAHAADRRRWELMERVFHHDATCWASSIGRMQPWRDTIEQNAAVFAGALGVTHHQLGNPFITLDGERAYSETYLTAYHRVRADAPAGGLFGGSGSPHDLVGGVRYIDQWERRDGAWKISVRRFSSEWRHLQAAADGVLASVPAEARGQYDDTDPAVPVIARFRSVDE